MTFFEAPPPPPEPPRQPRPEWAGVPENVIGAPVAFGVVLARTPDVGVAVTHVTAYPIGVELRLAVRTRRVLDDLRDPFHPVLRRSEPAAPERFKFGVQFADGRKATNIAGHWPQPEGGDPPGPVLWPGGGGGGGRSWNQDYWLWPLPPPGPFAFVCEWSSGGIPLTREEVDAAPILEAAGRAAVLWPPEDDDGGGRFTQYGVVSADTVDRDA